jgi:hypothetical protein
VLVTVQFPDDFGISNFVEVEILHLKPWLERRASAVYCVKMPIDLRAIVQIFIPKQIEMVPANLFRPDHNLIGLPRNKTPEFREECRDLGESEEEAPK